MKFEHKALSFAVALAALVPACYVVSEKPADSAPPVSTAGAGGAAAAVPTTAPPLTTSTATTPEVSTRPPSLHAATPLPSTFGMGGAGGSGGGAP
ncbi:MAG: hypothetical protein ABIQ16_01095 [Polyangiaceae bacterium]